jgi:hypothetical protein
MPLLRRGVKNIIACVATRTEPTVSLEQFAIGTFPQLSRLTVTVFGKPLLLAAADCGTKHVWSVTLESYICVPGLSMPTPRISGLPKVSERWYAASLPWHRAD